MIKALIFNIVPIVERAEVLSVGLADGDIAICDWHREDSAGVASVVQWLMIPTTSRTFGGVGNLGGSGLVAARLFMARRACVAEGDDPGKLRLGCGGYVVRA